MNFLKLLKEKWEWFVGGIILLLGIFASSKTKDKVKEKDLKIRLDAEKDIAVKQEEIRVNSKKEREKIIKDHEIGTTLIRKEERERIDELSNDPAALDDYLQNLGLNKK